MLSLGDFLDKYVKVNKKDGLPDNFTARLNSNCEDTSYTRLLGITRSVVFVVSVTATSDGGMLVPLVHYDSTVIPNPSWRTLASLMKLDDRGNLLWIKQFQDLTPGQFNDYAMTRAYELPNHDIVCTAHLSLNGSAPYFTDVYRLTPDGNIIWKNRLKSTIGLNTHPGTYTFYPKRAIEGQNGDVLICGYTFSSTPISNVVTVIRLNNQGQKVWDANYGNVDLNYFGSFAEGVDVYLTNGQIKVIGSSDGSIGPRPITGIVFLKLDYGTGNLVSKRIFRPEYTDPNLSFDKSFGPYFSKTVQLANGNLLFYGKLRSDFYNYTPGIHHYGVVEFDANDNLVDAYSVSSNLKTAYENNGLLFDASGKGLLMLFQANTYPNYIQYFGSFRNYQFLKLRKKQHINVSTFGYNGFAHLQDGGYAYLQSNFGNFTTGNSYISFSRMHDSDTSSQCLGTDTSFLRFLPLNVIQDPSFYFLDSNFKNYINTFPMSVSQTDTTTLNETELCEQKSYCDTVRIHGNGNICGYPTAVTFTAFKNIQCGAFVQWNISNSAIDSMRVVNDSTITIWPKNINWQGMLYATVPGSACYALSADSLLITITGTPRPVDIGPDTTICPANTIVLNAQSGYASYLWQDGSTDSLFNVTQPGLYYVTVSDACGNQSSDTVNVLPHSPVYLSLGPDRSVCRGDTLQISAQPGFLNYAWQPNYNISSQTAQQVVVRPLVDTSYTLQAESEPGCFAYDTIRITVKAVSPLSLGPDTRFCTGDSLTLNAGPGFVQYNWSTGATTPQLVVHNAGLYWVAAKNANGCTSRDTLTIDPLYALPVINLGADAPLCSGNSRQLDAGPGYTQYLWNTGSNAQSITVNSPGPYAVQVVDANGCKGSDTTRVTQLLPLPAAFLPADTAICNYGSTTLTPLTNYAQYLWSTGSRQTSISITQPGLYWLQVTDLNNCSGRDSIQVTLKECMRGVYVPSAFTPDNNGRNDLFRPLVFGNLEKYEFVVYDRAGQILYRSTIPGSGWDGRYKGIPLSSGVYVWICHYQLSGEAASTQKGTVTIIR